MKIAICTPVFSTNIYSSEYNLASGLRELGHDVTIISTRTRTARQLAWPVDEKNDGGITGVTVRWLDAVKGLHEPLHAYHVDEAVRDGRYDFGIVSEDWRPVSFQFHRALKKYDVLFMVDSERYSRRVMGPVRSTIQWLQDHSLAKRMWDDAVAVTCHANTSVDFHRRIGTPEEKLAFIPSSVDTRIFRPLERKFGDGPVQVLNVARLEPQKGQEALIRATTHLDGIHLTIKGRGPLRDHLGAMAREAGVDVTFDEESIRKESLPEYYAQFDIYCQPSLDEPSGMSVLEAMACGLPIIATEEGGLRDSVENHLNGLTVKRENFPIGVIEQIETCLSVTQESEELRKAMGGESRRIAVEKFDNRVVAQQHVEIAEKRGL